MTIQRANAPPKGRAIIESALQARVQRTTEYAALRGVPSLLDPVPVYHLDLKSIADGPGTKNARRVGWWYVVIGGLEPAIAMLQDSGGDLRFVGITQGLLAKRFFQACDLAEARLSSPERTFEPRVFDVPTLDIIALWLVGRDQYFIPLLDGTPPGTATLKLVSDIEGRLKDTFYRREKSRRAPLKGSPTN